MCCEEQSQGGEMPRGGTSAGSQGSQMGTGVPTGSVRTLTDTMEPVLAAYLRQRQDQTAPMVPIQQGEMPGGGMGAAPQQSHMGAMALSQQGEMPGGSMDAAPQQGEMPSGSMDAVAQQSQMM